MPDNSVTVLVLFFWVSCLRYSLYCYCKTGEATWLKGFLGYFYLNITNICFFFRAKFCFLVPSYILLDTHTLLECRSWAPGAMADIVKGLTLVYIVPVPLRFTLKNLTTLIFTVDSISKRKQNIGWVGRVCAHVP